MPIPLNRTPPLQAERKKLSAKEGALSALIQMIEAAEARQAKKKDEKPPPAGLTVVIGGQSNVE